MWLLILGEDWVLARSPGGVQHDVNATERLVFGVSAATANVWYRCRNVGWYTPSAKGASSLVVVTSLIKSRLCLKFLSLR